MERRRWQKPRPPTPDTTLPPPRLPIDGMTVAMLGNSPAQHHSEASLRAAKSAQQKLSDRARLVRGLVAEHQPISDERLGMLSGLPGDTIRPIRGKLANLGLIEPAGLGTTRSGHACTLWRVPVRSGE